LQRPLAYRPTEYWQQPFALTASTSAATLVELKALPDSYKRRQFIEAGGWAKMPGQTSVDSDIAERCSSALTT
jgi:hypothetical protein